ncbi:hypothetical protein PybrP1_002804, partial [[Pythium] brassicae (nom. inval.)]
MWYALIPAHVLCEAARGFALVPLTSCPLLAAAAAAACTSASALTGRRRRGLELDAQPHRHLVRHVRLIRDGGRFKVFRKWGRVGAANPQSATEFFSSVEPAKSAFQKAFASKSGNAWPLTNGAFAKKKGKYVFVELADDEPDDSAGGSGSSSGAADGSGDNNNNNNKSNSSASTAQSKLSEPVQDVIKLICDSSLIAKEVSSMNVDLKRMPLGRLSKAQISQGYALLQQLSDALTAIEAIESSVSAAASATSVSNTSTAPVAAPSASRASRRRATASTATPTSVAAASAPASSSVTPTPTPTTTTTPATGSRRSTRGRAASAAAASAIQAATATTPTTASSTAATPPAPTTTTTTGGSTRKKKLSAADTNRVRDLKAELKTLTSEFYSLIPHDFGRALPPVLDSLEVVKTKIDLLQVLADIELSQQLQQEEKKRAAATGSGGAAEPTHPLDAQYAMLKTEMEALDPASDEFQVIERFVARTQAPSQTAYRLKIKSVLKITRPAEQEPRAAFAHVDNHRLLWHGSRLSNVVGILSQGLRVAPPEAPKNGYMFGKGIYFADSVSKSAHYCWTSPDRPRAVLLLAEVALGKSYEAPRAEYLDFAAINARGCASTKGVGRMAPREETFEKTPDGVVVPSGQIVAQPAAPSGAVLFNEFIVYRPEQVKLRYLITTDFDYSAGSVPRPVPTGGFGSTTTFGNSSTSGGFGNTSTSSAFGNTSTTATSSGFRFGGGGGSSSTVPATTGFVFGAPQTPSVFGGGFGTGRIGFGG